MTRAWIGFVSLAFYVGVLMYGCAAAAESSYTAQQLQCVDRATTLAESKACRAEVDRAWHVVDGGVQ